MIRIILLLTVFSFLDHVTEAPPNTKFETKAVMWNKTKLQKFVEKLMEECDFSLLDSIYKDLKMLWARAMKEEIEDISRMNYEKAYLRNLTEQYNKCSEKGLHTDFEGQWEIYLKIFGKEYNGTEKETRKEIFKKNKENVKQHNEMYEKGTVSYSVNLNHFSDWTEQELEKMNGFRPPRPTLRSHSSRKARHLDGFIWKYYYFNPNNTAPASVDWRTKGNYVSPVKQQGLCGSCYAMASLGALEAYHKKKTGEFVMLSTQNILDCTWHLGNKGCECGRAYTVFVYAYAVGVVSNSRYPYTMNASHNCRWRREDVVATNRGYYVVEEGNELALRDAVADHGPVAVSIGVKNLKTYRSGDLEDRCDARVVAEILIQAYSGSGVFDTLNCGNPRHVVLIVGYGTDPVEGDYWIVKNSWGYWWGEDGYFRLARNKHNMCYIASYARFPY